MECASKAEAIDAERRKPATRKITYVPVCVEVELVVGVKCQRQPHCDQARASLVPDWPGNPSGMAVRGRVVALSSHLVALILHTATRTTSFNNENNGIEMR